MNNKKIIVLVKFFNGEINPFDASALECALKLSNDVIVVSMSPLLHKNQIHALTRLGAKAVMVSDMVFAGSDTLATSYVLASAVKNIEHDLIFCGRQSVDGDTAQVPPMVARRLGYQIIQEIMSFDGENAVTRDGTINNVTEKTVLSFEKTYNLRFPSIFSKLGDIKIVDNTTLKLDVGKVGLQGSPTKVIKVYESNVGRRNCKFIDFAELYDVILTSLNKKRTNSTLNPKRKLDKVYYIGKVTNTALAIADTCEEITCDLNNVSKIVETINKKDAKIILVEDNLLLKTIIPQVAVDLNAGMCADCVSFNVDDRGRFVMTRPARGGNITADIISDSEITFATVRTVKKSEDIIFSIGKGAIDSIDKIKDLAKNFNAELCCSRTIADSGVLPYSMQVGLTGKRVSPLVYVAFGISGAVQHTCAIEGAQTIIAINNNKNSRIFDYADYGIVGEVENVKL